MWLSLWLVAVSLVVLDGTLCALVIGFLAWAYASVLMGLGLVTACGLMCRGMGMVLIRSHLVDSIAGT